MCQYLLIRNRCICSCRRCRGGQYSRRWQSKGGGPCLLWWCGAGRGLAASVTRPKTENIFPFPKKYNAHLYFNSKWEHTAQTSCGRALLGWALACACRLISFQMQKYWCYLEQSHCPLPLIWRHTTTNLPVKYVLLSKCCSAVFILNSQARWLTVPR